MLWFFWLLIALFVVYVLNLIVVLVLENRDPHKTIAWILVLVFIPIFGIIAYFWAGENLKQKFYSWRLRRPKYANVLTKIVESQKEFLHNAQLPVELQEKRHTMYLALHSTNYPFSKNNSVEILNNGSEFFPSLFDEIEKAKEHIHLEFYLFRNDEITKKLIDCLIKKAKCGIKVRILLDGFGSQKFIRHYKHILKQNNIELGVFLPVRLTILKSKLNHRNHRKIAIFDGQTAFIGGMNIGQEYFNGGKYGFWRDIQLKINGPAVYSLQTIFVRDWFFATKQDIYDYKLYPKLETKGKVNLHIAPSGPDTKWENLKLIFFSIITTSEKKLYIETPYFIPDDSVLLALKSTALKGVDTRLIIPENPDLSLYKLVNLTYLPELLDVGVKVYSYAKGKNGVLHTKMLISDNISSVGSTNMNIRGLKLDFEVNAFIFDTNTTEKLTQIFYNDLKDCKEITKSDLIQQSKWIKLKQSLARLISPLL
ncbi:MAG: cardiolipin synthase [Candidatus Diapherotrites archaeon CG08_land_8_20_14_0_20_30_16]|nr:MAG: cardiolipin synthase [Candidatus Diapherotrites archaeon CG08_land_8_20_14_0_20_30_16]